jgi:hypothetical protein
MLARRGHPAANKIPERDRSLVSEPVVVRLTRRKGALGILIKQFRRGKRVEDCRHKRAAQELFHCRQEFVGRTINLNSEPFQRL